jgi:hypothetical protein
MGRPAEGNIRRRGNKVLASVPRLAAAPKRLETAFDTLEEAERWRDEQLARRAKGLEPERPPRPESRVRAAKASRSEGRTASRPRAAGVTTTSPSLQSLAERWHHEF